MRASVSISDEPAPAPPPGARNLRILMVTPRDLDQPPSTGREKLLHGVREQAARLGEVRVLTVPGVFGSRGKLAGLAWAGLNFLGDLTRGRPASIQSLLFRSPEGPRALQRAIAEFDPDVLYFDSVRLAHLIPPRGGRARVVIDLDDLLSRRLQSYARVGIGQSVGELGRNIPQPVVRALEIPLIGKAYSAAEKALTRGAELRVGAQADVLIMTSPGEGRSLARLARRRGRRAPHIVAHPLGVPLKPVRPHGPVTRLTFIGTDRLPQNQDGILWCRKAAKALPLPVEIYGSGAQAVVAGEPQYKGFVADLGEVYGPDALATCMTRVRGGVKTKVLEAWAWGAPILVTPQALDGIDIEDYPLVADWHASPEAALALATPEAMARAVAVGREYLQRTYGVDVLQARWRAVFDLACRPRDAGR